MFPLKDDNPTLFTPYVTVFIIAVNVAVWLTLEHAGSGPGYLQALCQHGLIPGHLTGEIPAGTQIRGGRFVCTVGGEAWWSVFTSMFMHGGWLHLIMNMWFFWVFGNNIEDAMGHVRFAVFYLLCGVLATVTHVASGPGSPVPTIGASGAISGVMGAYLVLYPRVRVYTLFIIFIIIRIIPLPAWLLLLEWFALQLFTGAAGAAGGVAVWAHVGGFVAGGLLIPLFRSGELLEAKRRAGAHIGSPLF
jgi:membrane associated rhomboid family serine protease